MSARQAWRRLCLARAQIQEARADVQAAAEQLDGARRARADELAEKLADVLAFADVEGNLKATSSD